MSAAGPAPPPHRAPPAPSSNRAPASRAMDQPSGVAPAGRDVSNSGHPGSPKPLPHIQDLVVKAERRIEESRHHHLDKMLNTAELSLKQSRFFIDLGRPDQAYVEYLVGFQIVTDLIKKAKDSSTLEGSRAVRHKELIRLVNADQNTFIRVRDTIKADNERNHMRPTSTTSQASPNRPVPASPATAATGPTSHVAAQSTQRFSVTAAAPLSGRPVPQGPRPPVDHARSQSFQNQLPSTNGSLANGEDGLAERFAKLRAGGRGADSRTQSISTLQSVSTDTSVRRDSPSLHIQAPSEVSRVNGMQAPAPQSINTTFSQDFPKAPSPTYTPIRSMQSPTAIAPPRSARSSIQLHDQVPQSSAPTSSPTGQAASKSLLSKHASRRSEDLESQGSPVGRRRKSVHRPMETEIDAQKLFDYLQTYSVLLIDVRSREDYDAGHIYSSTGICIEPTALRANMSADELHEALVLSPQEEQEFFDHRDLFDLVVYYDESSTAVGRAKAWNPAMVYLQESLYEYNQEKPLRFPPILLEGGLDAWVDMMGNQSLKMSNTAHRPRIAKPRSNSRAYASSRIDAQKRRHRDYNPLAPEEEQKWRERARSESIVLDAQPPRQPAAEGNESDNSYDMADFARRYPDVSMVDSRQQPRQQPTPEPSRIPTYPTPPKSSQQDPALPPQTPPSVPPVPSRPPPAIARPSYSGVSERASSQQKVPQRPQKLATYIPPRLKRVPRVGLHNFGATCYMNSTIQCMSATIDLTAIFLDGGYKKDVQPENWKGSKGLMPELFCILLRNLWESNDVDTIRPTNFRKFCARLNKEWGTDRQQDAKEFLDFLLDILHEDLNLNWKHNPLRALTTEEEARRERMPPFMASKLEWDRYVHRDKSRLTDLFAGQHISRLQCTTCKHTSTTYEAFYSISVEIPQVSRPVTIYDCLKSYCQAERLSGDEVWKCPRCQCEREAIKRITITRVPSFLVIHFKRFSASHSERARKIHTPVEFPLRDLDLQPFVLPPPGEIEKEQITKNFGPRMLETPSCMTPPYRYDAYAITRHLGQTMASGHYIGLVKDRARGCWREFNDDRVTDFRPEDLSPSKRLQNEHAYIVFYQRVQPT